jgi:DNA-binding NarL/FixJ family response regulator
MATADPIRVLVVDDQSDARFLIGVILGDHDDMQIVAEAGSAAEALEQFDAAAPDVAIVDLRMPAVDGLELSRLLLERRPDLPIAILTSIVDEYIERQALEAGARVCASKEEFDALPDIVRALAGRENQAPGT